LSKKAIFRVDELATKVGGQVAIETDGSVELSGLASLADAEPQDLSFYTGSAYAAELAQTRAGALLIAKHYPKIPVPQILVPDPFLATNQLLDLFYPVEQDKQGAGVHSLAAVADSAELGEGVRIMPFACIGKGTTIGARTTIHPGVKIDAGVQVGEDCLFWHNAVIRERAIIGSRVTLHPGAVIGADGFGYARRNGRFIKLRHIGIVVIEDDVEIGANATIDRANLGRTVIRRGVKLDNLVHLAHNVQIGEDSAIAAQCGISGSTVIGKRVLMGGQVGLVDHLNVGDEAILIAQSGVIGNIETGAKVSGYPARPHQEVLRSQAEMRNLGRLRERVRILEEKLAQLVEKGDEGDRRR
jgi:UDP-3-O-[3-hydroxymyristoyl] glucosamine N-acyltransferase